MAGDSEFVKALREERGRRQAELSDANRAIGPAREAKETAHLNYQQRVGRSPQYQRGHVEGEKDVALARASTDAAAVVTGLEQTIARASARLEEIDRFLEAPASFARARAEVAEHKKEVARIEQDAKQLGDIETAIEGEKGDLRMQRARLLADHSKADLDARLAGKRAPAPKEVASIDADLEARDVTLATVKERKAGLDTALAQRRDLLESARRRLDAVLAVTYELEYFAALPKLKPILAKLSVLGSTLAGIGEFTITIDDADLRAAQLALREEIGAL